MVEAEPASIEEKTSSPIMAMKDDRAETAEKDLIAEAAWPEDGLRTAGRKMGAGTEVASNAEIVSGNNVTDSSVVLRRHRGLHA
jgi:hypothetical protein